MIKKRSKFWTVIFSFLPGAGHMYMGFMQMGLSLMSLFFGVIFFAMMFNFLPLLFVLPLIMCYSFFHCIALMGADDESFAKEEDRFLLFFPQLLTGFGSIGANLFQKRRPLIGGILILMGIYMFLWQLPNFLNMNDFIYRNFYSVMSAIPQILFNLAIIVVGFLLIRGKKNALALPPAEEAAQ